MGTSMFDVASVKAVVVITGIAYALMYLIGTYMVSGVKGTIGNIGVTMTLFSVAGMITVTMAGAKIFELPEVKDEIRKSTLKIFAFSVIFLAVVAFVIAPYMLPAVYTLPASFYDVEGARLAIMSIIG